MGFGSDDELDDGMTHPEISNSVKPCTFTCSAVVGCGWEKADEYVALFDALVRPEVDAGVFDHRAVLLLLRDDGVAQVDVGVSLRRRREEERRELRDGERGGVGMMRMATLWADGDVDSQLSKHIDKRLEIELSND